MEIITPKKPSRKPYIYKVTNFETHLYYIGSQCRGLLIGENYFTSSTNKAFKEDFEIHREKKYKIEIIKEFTDPDECVNVENYIIRNHMLLKDGLCLNKFYCCNNKKIFSVVGTHHSEETRRKISEACKGHPGWNKGIPWPEETKQKNSEAHKGTHHSEEAKEKISRTLKGRPSPRCIKISIEDVAFESLTEASKYYNVAVPTIRYWFKNKKHNAFYIK